MSAAAAAHDTAQDNPLLVGALAFAVGAAFAAALPRTPVENCTIGGHRDLLFDDADSIFREEVEKATSMAKDTVAEGQKRVKETVDQGADTVKEQVKARTFERWGRKRKMRLCEPNVVPLAS